MILKKVWWIVFLSKHTRWLPVSKVLPDWMNNVVEAENLKQQLKRWIVKVMTSRKIY
jgi:hypothetical protein